MTAIGMITLDNYDDIVDKMDDKQTSYLNTLVTTLISDWANENGIFYKRIEADRYFFVGKTEDLNRMKEQKFKLLQQVKDADINSELLMTASMGIAYGNASMAKIGEIAQSNLDMALARGGDQVVLKDSDPQAKVQFYGGTTEGTIKRTRTRSRAMSTALKRIFLENEQVFIMGHHFPDMDAIGSAFGVATLARFNKKDCYVVINREEVTEDIERCLTEIEKYSELEKLVISEEEALKKINQKSVLVMVDYHRPSLSISQKVFETVDKIIVIDHHRRGDEFPNRPLLTYIEPGASSASELVAELIQYQTNRKNSLEKFVATMLLAGIYVDTKSFASKTTAQTFFIASYLRNHGADLALVHYLLSTDLHSYLQMSELVSRGEHVTQDTVIAISSEDEIYDNVTAAKAADTLLSMNDIQAAFVITKQPENVIGINARSSGKINVQTIMEELGGGGHFSTAAAQFKGQNIDKVRDILIKELRKLDEE